jgi:hypothetical protein
VLCLCGLDCWCETSYSGPSSLEVKKEWSGTSTPLTRLNYLRRHMFNFMCIHAASQSTWTQYNLQFYSLVLLYLFQSIAVLANADTFGNLIKLAVQVNSTEKLVFRISPLLSLPRSRVECISYVTEHQTCVHEYNWVANFCFQLRKCTLHACWTFIVMVMCLGELVETTTRDWNCIEFLLEF